MKVFVLLLITLSVISCADLKRKQLAGPPEEFDVHRLPQPTAGALSSLSAMIQVDLQAEDDSASYSWREELPVDADEVFIFSYASPYASYTQLSLYGPDNKAIDLSSVASPGEFPIGGETVPVTNYVFNKLPIGRYTLEVRTVGELDIATKKKVEEETVDAYVIWFNYAPTTIYSHLSSYNAEVGQDLGLVAHIYETVNGSFTSLNSPPKALMDTVTSAYLVMELPDGEEVDVVMSDDGLHYDGVHNDGVFGGYLKAKKPGKYSAQVIVRGYDSKGNEFIRSTQHIIKVAPKFELTGIAIGKMSKTNNRIDVELGVHAEDNKSTYRAYAEVWGENDNGDEVAVCWVSSLVNVLNQDKVVLELDLNWIAMAKAKEPFTLRGVYVQDISSSIPVATLSEIPLKLVDEAHFYIVSHLPTLRHSSTITDEMSEGVRPNEYEVQLSSSANGALLLLHGYCTGSNPWEKFASNFTNGKYFLNPSASIGNDAFARKVLTWAAPYAYYSILGHSQGGAVAAHILNYYWSNVDAAPSGRLVQSVGTPYQGCSIAGTAASFGDLFGVGCGRNEDLTKDGAALWLAGITTKTRAKVNYYTTTYEQGTFFGDYCNLALNTLLAWPNDGTSEFALAQLPGAVNLGNKQKWCHTGSMKYAAQYTDISRNVEMSSLAAR